MASIREQYAKSGNIRELHEKLRDIPGSCPAFVGEVIRYAATDKSRKDKVLKFMREHPDAKPADVSKFVREQDDFHEAAKFALRE